MQSRFLKWIEVKDIPEQAQEALDDLHSQFARLSADEQLYAEKVIYDIQNGKLEVEPGKEFMQYIVEYRKGTHDGYVDAVIEALGLDRDALVELVGSCPTEDNLDAHGRFSYLWNTLDKVKAKVYFEGKYKRSMRPREVSHEAKKMLRRFILSGGYDINEDAAE